MDPISQVGASQATSGVAAQSSLGSLGKDAFLQLLVAQLKYQNPLSPTDGSEFMAQTAQFTTVETLQSIADSQQRLMGLQQVGIALGMVGHEVTALDAAGAAVSGEVDSVRFGADGPILNISGSEVRLENIVSITDDADDA